MLMRLALRNFVLIEEARMDFAAGFCVLTGETGAGKSLLVDALSLLVGGRGGGVIMPGAATAEVEAVFQLRQTPTLVAWLQENALYDGEELIARRVLSAGKSRAFINGRQVPLAQMAEAVSQLIDICGQHAHYSLQKPAAQMAFLDAYAEAEDDAAAVRTAHEQWTAAAAALAQSMAAAEANALRREELTEDIAELDALDFSSERWERQNAQLTRLAGIADLVAACTEAQRRLDGDSGAEQALTAARRAITAARRIDEALGESLECVEQSLIACHEAMRTLSLYAGNLSADPQAEAEAEAFVAAAHRLARKHRLADAAMLGGLLTDKKRMLSELEIGANIAEKQQAEKKSRAVLTKSCRLLTDKRRRAAMALGKTVNAMLPQLAMLEARLTVNLSPLDAPGPRGAERVEFLISTRRNVAAGGLAEVASGGELSRLGLALQIAAGRARPRAVVVFDEVDGGIGGATAAVVGKLLHTLGESRQVLCVTHLAQVAARANGHWRVRAIDGKNGRSATVDYLSPDDREEELARIVSGEIITDKARANAAELLRQARQ